MSDRVRFYIQLKGEKLPRPPLDLDARLRGGDGCVSVHDLVSALAHEPYMGGGARPNFTLALYHIIAHGVPPQLQLLAGDARVSPNVALLVVRQPVFGAPPPPYQAKVIDKTQGVRV